MQVTIVAIGSRGDVQPYVALGCGLAEAGIRVRIASYPRFASFVTDYGLEFFPIPGDPRESLLTDAGQDFLKNDGKGIAHTVRKGVRMIPEDLADGVRDCLAAAEGSDALLVSSLGLAPGYLLSEALKIPMIRCYLAPGTPTGDAPAFSLPRGISFGRRYNKLTYYWVRQMIWLALRPTMNKRARPLLDMPPLPLRDPMRAVDATGAPVVYGYSDSVIPRPSDWPDFVHITGYWFLPRRDDWTPDPALEQFLADGEPPVCITFGSMPGFDTDDLIRKVEASAQATGKRALVLSGWSRDALRLPDSDRVFVAGDVPHDWLFPRVGAIIQHGGAGTVAAALAAGKPTWVVPFLPDQRMWGMKVEGLGVGPAPTAPDDLTPSLLASGMLRLSGDASMARRAGEIAQRLSGEDGVGAAVKIITNYLP